MSSSMVATNAATKRRVLVVDDEENVTHLVSSALRFDGFETMTADSGTDALAKVTQYDPDLVVLDVMMPGRDGLDVLQELRKRPDVAAIPVVLLTAKATDADVWEGWKAGADYYMTKPFKPEDLASFAHNILGTAK